MNRIHDLIKARADSHSSHEAVVDGDRRIPYVQLKLDVERVAKALLALGVKRGDRVATLAPPCYEFLISYLGAVSIGAIWHGLNPRYQARDYRLFAFKGVADF